MIEVKDISYRYSQNGTDVEALKGVSMVVRDGEYVAIVGPNGSGKSTLAEHLNALLLPQGGEVLVDGVSTRSDPEGTRRRVGMVFQNPENQLFCATLEEDVAFGPENLGLPPQEVQARVGKALERLGLSRYARASPHRLSGGEKQLAAIAGVLAMEPSYLVLDEPTSLLDPFWKRRVGEVVAGLRDGLKGVVHVTHDLREASKADRIYLMAEGRMVLEGGPEILSGVEARRLLGL
ncbi:MAG: ATP-binding cassette domain-containing protein [Candidatus Hydrothermarchaeota archaeon]